MKKQGAIWFYIGTSKITQLDVIVTKIRLMRRKRELATNGSST